MIAYVDTAVPMYARGRAHPLREPSRAVLEMARDGAPFTISAEVVQEVLHRFLTSDDRDKGIVLAGALVDLFAPVLPFTHRAAELLPELAARYPAVSARDLVHIAICRENELSHIISPDRGFDLVDGLTRVAPDDEEALSRLASR